MTNERRAELYFLTGAVLWGLFPVITKLSFETLPPIVSLAISSLCAAIFFALVIFFTNKWRESMNIYAMRDILWVALIMGVLFYGLTFFGIQYTSPGNVAIIALSEIFWSYVFFNVWLKEHITRSHLVGALLMTLGAIVVLYPNASDPQWGDLIILIAAMVPPLGNFFMRRAREKVSSQTIMFWRSAIAGMVLLGAAYALYPHPLQGVFDPFTFMLLLVNGMVILGISKIFWIEGIRFVNIAKGNALSAISPLLTLLFAYLLLNQVATVWQLLALVPIAFGIYFLSRNNTRTS